MKTKKQSFAFGATMYHVDYNGVFEVVYCGRIDEFYLHSVLDVKTQLCIEVRTWHLHKTQDLAETYYQNEIKPIVIAHHGHELRKDIA